MSVPSGPRPPGPLVVLVMILAGAGLVPPAALHAVEFGPDHLVVSEVVTGGTSASDELIELYNPTSAPLPLEGLEVVYVSASGATISRRAAWEAGAPSVPAGAHLLVANEAGIYAGIADVTYATGIAATGGSVALRILGAVTAIDAVGWGSATGSWLEGTPAPAAPVGSSLERLPGGALGSGQDTGDNAADFAVRDVPDPQNAASPPVSPGAGPSPTGSPAITPEPSSTSGPSTTPAPTSEATPEPTAEPTPVPSAPSPSPSGSAEPTASPTVVSVAAARAMPDGAVATIEGTATTSSDFHDGGGYVADATGGIAVLLTDATFTRGEHLRITGSLDDRFAQRTIRAGPEGVVHLGLAAEPEPRPVTTGGATESVEGRLVRVSASVVSSATVLTSGVAFDIDDGSGPVRVLVAASSGIDTSGWQRGAVIDLVGVLGQRDSSGTGSSGYRLQPRDVADVLTFTAPTPTPSPSSSSGPSGSPAPSATATPSATASPDAGILTIAEARLLAKNDRVVVRGVVTLPTALVDEATAVVQDASGAIAIRMGDEAGTLALGASVELTGVRSTKSGMETIRVTTAPRHLAGGAQPAPAPVRTGEAGEEHEARLVVVRGSLVAAPRSASSGTVSFELDDGSGPLRVVVPAPIGFEDDALDGGDWLEVVGVVGQETTGAQPLRGYRVWPRTSDDIRVTATATGGDLSGDESAAFTSGASGRGNAASLDAVMEGAVGLPAGVAIAATWVAGAWPELDLDGLLWDGERLVALDPAAAAAVAAAVPRASPPLPLRLAGLSAAGTHPETAVPIVRVPAAAGSVSPGGSVAPPATRMPRAGESPRWVSIVGRLTRAGERLSLVLPTGPIPVTWKCESAAPPAIAAGAVSTVGIGTGGALGLVVGCDGVRRAPALGLDPRAAPIPPRVAPERASAAPAPADDARLMAAVLLAIAALLLAAAGLGRRWLMAHDERVAPADDANAPDQPGDDGIRTPTLTLVPVPREQGS